MLKLLNDFRVSNFLSRMMSELRDMSEEKSNSDRKKIQ